MSVVAVLRGNVLFVLTMFVVSSKWYSDKTFYNTETGFNKLFSKPT